MLQRQITLPYLFLFLVLIPSIIEAHAFILAIEGSNGARSTGFGTRLTSRGTLVQNTGIIHQGDINSGSVTPCGRIFGGDGLPASPIDVEKEMAIGQSDFDFESPYLLLFYNAQADSYLSQKPRPMVYLLQEKMDRYR